MDTQAQIDQLTKDLKALNDEVYANNFTAHQDFNKSVSFTTKLKVPHYTAVPTICEVGEICEVGGKLRICSSNNVWAIVGSQS